MNIVSRLKLNVPAVLLAVSLTGSVASAQEDSNWWTDLQGIKTTASAVNAFFGDEKGSYFAPDRKVASQVIEGLGGGPDPEVVFGDGLRFHSAVRPGSGPEGAAVVLDQADRVVYVGLIHFNCARVTSVKDSTVAAHLAAHSEKIATSCDNHPTMTIFTKSTLTQSANETFQQWVNRQYKSEKITINVRSLN